MADARHHTQRDEMQELSHQDMQTVQGGIALLLPHIFRGDDSVLSTTGSSRSDYAHAQTYTLNATITL